MTDVRRRPGIVGLAVPERGVDDDVPRSDAYVSLPVHATTLLRSTGTPLDLNCRALALISRQHRRTCTSRLRAPDPKLPRHSHLGKLHAPSHASILGDA
jgi:hypothetical protein